MKLFTTLFVQWLQLQNFLIPLFGNRILKLLHPLSKISVSKNKNYIKKTLNNVHAIIVINTVHTIIIKSDKRYMEKLDIFIVNCSHFLI